jgi:hypothetical protein
MNREDIIRMAREAGDADRIDPFTKDGDWVILTPDELERFTAFVASAEREACANLCEQHGYEHYCGNVTDKLAETIRARGQA